jgi:hypothetical protein
MPRDNENAAKEAQEAAAATIEFVEAAKASAAAAAETQALIVSALADAQAKLTEITTAATQSIAARTQITDLQAVIATKSDHIEDAQVHADKVRADLDRKLTETTQHVTEAEGMKSRVQSAADNATNLLTEIRTSKGSVETDATAIAEARKTAEESAALAKGLADKSATIETRIADYEKLLDDLHQQAEDRLKTINDLLPGATSAGLAHSLDNRRQTFLKPHNRWQWIFVLSLLAVVAIAVSGMWHVYHLQTVPSYDQLLRLWLSRLPVVGALIWLALHSSHESALAKRLEEDYGYKSAIAASFEGFRRQMAELSVDAKPDSPLAKLCDNTLTTIATPPGRIYDKHQLIISPIKELNRSVQAAAEALKPAVEAANALKPLA